MNDQKLDLILMKLEKMETKLEKVETKLEKVETEQQRHGDHIHQLLQIVGATNARLSETNLRIDESNKKIDESNMKIHETNLRIDESNARLGSLAEDVNILKLNQQSIMSLQQDQQKILERLSVRSISQEADIAELRRIK